MTDQELLSKAIAFNVGPEAFVNGKAITPELIVKLKETGEYNHLCCAVKWTGSKWVISNGHSCLNKMGEWEYASMPSNQEDDFRDRTRFACAQTAIEFFERHRRLELQIYDEIKDKFEGRSLWEEQDRRMIEEYKKLQG